MSTTAQLAAPEPAPVTITTRGDRHQVTCTEHGHLGEYSLIPAAQEIRRWHMIRDHGQRTIYVTLSAAEYDQLLHTSRELGMDPDELVLDALQRQLHPPRRRRSAARHLVVVP